MKKTLKILTAVIVLFLLLSHVVMAAMPATAGRQALLLYNGDDAFGANAAYVGQASIYNMLTSAGPIYTGNGFNFTVETINVPVAYNTGLTYATGNSVLTGPTYHTALPFNPQNYCLVVDARFNNENYNDGLGGAGAAGTNYVRGDTIVQADVTNYQTFVEAGGDLLVIGDN
jgi:hypothetical protein